MPRDDVAYLRRCGAVGHYYDVQGAGVDHVSCGLLLTMYYVVLHATGRVRDQCVDGFPWVGEVTV